MSTPNQQQRELHTTTGDVPLLEYRLRLAGREWSILHTGAMLTHADELHFFREFRDRLHLPYGVALWPAAIALAHEIAARDDTFRGRRVLELGAGTGLPGIVAASLGALVVQTDRYELPMSVCKQNGARNGVAAIDYRLADWIDWNNTEQYDWIIGSDILYGEVLHPQLRHIFETNLAPAGRILLSDPFRSVSLSLLEAMETDGWTVALNKWSVGEEAEPRSIGVYELTQPAANDKTRDEVTR